MALYHHRLAHSKEVLVWGGKCLTYPATTNDKSGEARLAATHCAMAVARFRLGDRPAAEAELRETRDLIVKGRRATLSGEPAEAGSWYTWVIARLLFAEAEQEILGISEGADRSEISAKGGK